MRAWIAALAILAAAMIGPSAHAQTAKEYADEWTEARRGDRDWKQRATEQLTMSPVERLMGPVAEGTMNDIVNTVMTRVRRMRDDRHLPLCPKAAVERAFEQILVSERKTVMAGAAEMLLSASESSRLGAEIAETIGEELADLIKEKLREQAFDKFKEKMRDKFREGLPQYFSDNDNRGNCTREFRVVWDKAAERYMFIFAGDCACNLVDCGPLDPRRVRLRKWTIEGWGTVVPDIRQLPNGDKVVRFVIGPVQGLSLTADCCGEGSRRFMTYPANGAGNEWVGFVRQPATQPQPPRRPQTGSPPPPPPSGPQRPAYNPLQFPTVPRFFCSEEERQRYIDELNQLIDRALENVERAARFRTEVERAINEHVQNDRPVPRELIDLRRRAAADYAEQQRLADEAKKLRERAGQVPVVDCRKQRPFDTSPEEQRLRDRLSRTSSEFGDARSRCDPAAMAAAIAELERLLRQARDRLSGLQVQDERYLSESEASELSAAETDVRHGERLLEQARRQQRECPRTTTAPPQPPLDRTAATILNYHNQLRAEAGVPPLKWNPELAAGAAVWAAELSRRGRVEHAPREGRRTMRENLLQSPRGTLGLPQMLERWGRERRYYRPGIFPDVSTTGNWSDVAHYTQMIWSTTTDLGCAVLSDRSYDWMICRYSPPGNQDGRPVKPMTERGQ